MIKFLGCATIAFIERFLHVTLPFGRSCIRSSCTPLFRKRFGYWAQGLPLATALKSVISQRLCWVSLRPAVLCCTEMRLPLTERVLSTAITFVSEQKKSRKQESNKTTSRSFAPISAVIFVIFQ
jgi:hypothetical protein